MGGHTASSRQLPELEACFIRSFQELWPRTMGGWGHLMSLLSSFTPARPPVPQKAPSPWTFLSACSILLLLPLRQAPRLLRPPRKPDIHSPSSPMFFPAQPGSEACPRSFTLENPSCLSPPDLLLFKFGAHIAPKRILKTTDDTQTFLVGF